jgi:hypothetical protein
VDSEPTEEAVDRCLDEIKKLNELGRFLKATATALVELVDWRTSSTPGLPEKDRLVQAQYRGSSGYRALNERTINALAGAKDRTVASAAKKALQLAA